MKDIIRNLESIKISTFIALYPALYKLIRRYQHHQALPPNAQTSSIASISLLPLVLLLPSSITTHLNLYSFSALAVSIANKAELDGHLTRIPRWLKKGGGWWLFPLTQGWLLYLSVFEPHTFPDTYKRVIVNVSRETKVEVECVCTCSRLLTTAQRVPIIIFRDRPSTFLSSRTPHPQTHSSLCSLSSPSRHPTRRLPKLCPSHTSLLSIRSSTPHIPHKSERYVPRFIQMNRGV